MCDFKLAHIIFLSSTVRIQSKKIAANWSLSLDCICICVFMYFLFAYQSGHLIAKAPLNTAVCGKLACEQDQIRPGWPVTRHAGTEYWNCRIIYYIMIYHILSYSYHSIFYIFNMDHLGWLHTVQNLSPRSIIVKHFQNKIFCMKRSPLLIKHLIRSIRE